MAVFDAQLPFGDVALIKGWLCAICPRAADRALIVGPDGEHHWGVYGAKAVIRGKAVSRDQRWGDRREVAAH